jgi:hypothetical protein
MNFTKRKVSCTFKREISIYNQERIYQVVEVHMKLVRVAGKKKAKGGKRMKIEIKPHKMVLTAANRKRRVRDVDMSNPDDLQAKEYQTTTDLIGELGPNYVASVGGRWRTPANLRRGNS